eukprot:scaffold14349_cov63-Phaeocystis_antarctica.AAC.2
MLLHPSKGEEEEGAKAETGRWTSDTGRVTPLASWRTMKKQCAQQLSTPPSPSPRKPSMLERAAGPLLRRAGSLCVLVLALVLVPTALQLRRVLQQDDGIIDTDIASFRSVTGRYTDRQDAFWLLLIDSNATLLHNLAHASSAACIGVRGEACLSGWARVTHAVGTAPLWQAPCGDECAACEPLSYETLPCMRHWEAQP